MMRTATAGIFALASSLTWVCNLQAQSAQRIAELRPCSLPSGAKLDSCRIGYRTFGQAASAKAILVPTWFGGKSADWAALLGREGLIDTAGYYVIVVDALGGAVSSSPSTDLSFPQITIEDMVETQYRLAHDVLRLNHLHAVAGVSMGGIQTFEWAAAHPEFVDRFVSIVGSPQMARHDRAWLQTLVRVIDAGKAYHIPQDSVWRMLAGIFVLMDVQETVNKRSAAEADSLLVASANEMSKASRLDDWSAQARAILAYNFYGRPGSDSGSASARLRGRFLVVNSPDDGIVSSGPPMDLARRLGLDTLMVRSSCGHGVFVCEKATVGRVVQSFLSGRSLGSQASK